MTHALTRRQPATPPHPSPSLLRSSSGAENDYRSINISQRFTARSKSTTRSRNSRDEENIKKLYNRETCSSRNGFVRLLQRGATPRNSPATKKAESTSSSPSAWALSPGRSLFNMFPAPELPLVDKKRGKVKGGGGGAVSSVLKYFKQKKESPVQEDGYHRFRVLLNRLLQWRFANARAEATMLTLRTIAEDRFFHVWIRIFNLRRIILEKRIQIQKLKHDIKLCEIMNGQMSMLTDWGKIESKNCEAVSRMTRKLSAISIRLPLGEEAKGDVESLYKAMNAAVEVMGNIEATITKFLFQEVEKILYLFTELTSTLEHQTEILGEMESIVTLVSHLLAWEKSLRVQLTQLVKESRCEHQNLSRIEPLTINCYVQRLIIQAIKH